MEASLQKFARGQLIEGLQKCNEQQVHLFKRMYSHNNLDADIEEIVAALPENKLDWALQQVNRTLAK